MRITTYLPDDFSEEIVKMQFEEGWNILRNINEPLHSKMKTIFKIKDINAKKFVECTGLPRHYFYDFQREGYVPEVTTLVSVCMGLNLDLPTAESLLAPTKFSFNYANKTHCAYIFLLTHYQGLCIEDCNKVLHILGIDKASDLLGTITADDRKEKNKKN